MYNVVQCGVIMLHPLAFKSKMYNVIWDCITMYNVVRDLWPNGEGEQDTQYALLGVNVESAILIQYTFCQRIAL